jgi:hypothetical protein
MRETCISCGKSLMRDEIAIHKKLINRGADRFLCIHCLSEYFKVDERLIYEKITYFKEQGCTLFSGK